uniref:G_PROTEIN_RECEP_F1_2 domain-containing protein n=1 Tax=Caenorhabditis tropicalis TaxID=1561998 RepID=A0A1I7U9N8_9PELO
MMTVLFCGLRVAILYSVGTTKTKMMIRVVPWIIFLVSLAATSPQFLSDGMCIQMSPPYPFGSIAIINGFSFSNVIAAEIQELSFIIPTCAAIIVLSAFMIRKLNERSILNLQTASKKYLKIERTLTWTMVILLVPLLLHLFLAIIVLLPVTDIFRTIISYTLLTRPLVLDFRLHIATLYFYYTHPVFKNDRMCKIASGSQILHSR